MAYSTTEPQATINRACHQQVETPPPSCPSPSVVPSKKTTSVVDDDVNAGAFAYVQSRQCFRNPEDDPVRSSHLFS